ncbi:hypothetical protein JW977_03360 [Candidatus Falkowbacteria bacterium]|nr:hypothetical protein [Candidatus Falkowbacteria bacterium]
MKKTLFFAIIFCALLVPGVVLASPGQLDQYGGHECEKDCLIYGLANGEYHFHDIPNSPSYLSGFIEATNLEKIFYLPSVIAEEMTENPISIVNDEPNAVISNTIYDNQLCQNAEIFATGRYTLEPKVRITPVCAQRLIDGVKITAQEYYKNLPNVNPEITKVYHILMLDNGKTVFTDMPGIAELKGLIVQGVTDTSLYYINPNDENPALRPITEEKAIQLKGVNYKLGITYFDDSIIYSYPFARPLL